MYSKNDDSYFGSQMKEKHSNHENSGSMYEGNIYHRLESIGNQIDRINAYVYGFAEKQTDMNDTLSAGNRELKTMLDENTKSIIKFTKLHEEMMKEYDQKIKRVEYENSERYDRLRNEQRELINAFKYSQRMNRLYKIISIVSAVVSVSALLVSIIF